MDTRCYPCLGAIIGDTVGSIYEFENIKTTDFPFFSRKSDYTDDSIMTIAVADWLATTDRSQAALENILVDWAEHNPCPMGGYGDSFRRWLFQPEALFWFDSAGDSTVFILFMLKCLQATIKHEVENKVEGKVEDKLLTDSEQRIVRLMTKDAHITIAEICKKTKLSAAGVNKILASLRNKGIIKRIGANKNGYWDVYKK